jgi:hypothetical protein
MPPRVGRGVFVPPRIDGPLDVAAILADIERREFMPLPELGAKIGLGEQARKHAIHEGLIDANKRPSRLGGYTVSRDEAITLLLAAALAIAAGVAIATMLRGIKGAGVTGAAAAAALQAMTT